MCIMTDMKVPADRVSHDARLAPHSSMAAGHSTDTGKIARISRVVSPLLRLQNIRTHTYTIRPSCAQGAFGFPARVGVVAEDVTPKLPRGAGARLRGVVTRLTTLIEILAPRTHGPSTVPQPCTYSPSEAGLPRHGPGAYVQPVDAHSSHPDPHATVSGLPCRRAAWATSVRASPTPASLNHNPTRGIPRRNPSVRHHAQPTPRARGSH